MHGFKFTLGVFGLMAAALIQSPATADGGVRFEPLADAAVEDYRRAPSSGAALIDAWHQAADAAHPVSMADLIELPMMAHGLPGIAIFDFDGDGDLDIYATNGPDAANVLLSNQLEETGVIGFVDVARAAGVDALDQDSFGTCAGDIDNDGDTDLIVLGRNEPNRLFENRGNRTFSEPSGHGLGGGDLSSSSCGLADFDGDGLLDVVIANAFDQDYSHPIFVEPYDLNQHNQLFFNAGGNRFDDVSAVSGIRDNGAFYAGRPGITWAVGAVDIDADGDTDIVFADDQAGIMPQRVCDAGIPAKCEDRALLHAFLNDGSGQFTDHPLTAGPEAASEWMGLAFGDLNCDRHVDLFATSFGDYGMGAMGMPYVGGSSSRWWLGDGSGEFSDPGVGALEATPFGWGAAIFDYDNDGDLDVHYHGGLHTGMGTISDNPGVMLRNVDCSGRFVADTDALVTDHIDRSVRALAVGDLNRDGFVDLVSAASVRLNPATPLVPTTLSYGSAYDQSAYFAPLMAPVTPPGDPDPRFAWMGLEAEQGDLVVELSSGDNGNGSVRVTLQGNAGLIPGAVVNREGIGALVSFTPQGGKTVTLPVVAGSSHASQHALERVFGLGEASTGTLEVLWPGGRRTVLHGVPAGPLTLPEVPCDVEIDLADFAAELSCEGEPRPGAGIGGALLRP